MGLMKRVLSEARTDPGRPSAGGGIRVGQSGQNDDLRPELVTRALLLEVANIPASIEAPAHVFSMLKRNLRLSKAALLLPDPDERTFVPWSVTGFDMTSQRRLHIPEDTAYSLFSSRAPLFRILAGAELAQLEQYFSVREASSARYIGLASFFYEAKLLAILVVAETPYFGVDHTIMQVMYSAYEGSVSTLLHRSRDARISKVQVPILFSHEQLSSIAHEALADHAEEKTELVFLDFSTDRAVHYIAEKMRETDEYRIRQDVLRILNTMLAGLGKVFLFPDHRLVLLRTENARSTRPLDLHLLVHQINRRLEGFFDELAGREEIIEFRQFVYPRDSADLEELAARLHSPG